MEICVKGLGEVKEGIIREEGQEKGMDVPWRVSEKRDVVLLTLPEAEGQKGRAAGIFYFCPWDRSVPLH